MCDGNILMVLILQVLTFANLKKWFCSVKKKQVLKHVIKTLIQFNIVWKKFFDSQTVSITENLRHSFRNSRF